MAKLVCGGAMLKCSFGQAPSTLMTLPANKVYCSLPVANIDDNKPLANILPFAMCQSTSNPAVISATSAAMGVFTPAPCIPNTVQSWSDGCQTVKIGGKPALKDSSKLKCLWNGVIEIKNAGQMNTNVP